MDLTEALLGRRTVHTFTHAPVEEAVVDALLLAAHHAPCHKLTWPWRFTRVGPRTRATLTHIGAALKEAGHALTAEQRAGVVARLEAPPVLIVVGQRRCQDPTRAREDYAAVACAIQNLQLAAHGAGLGAKWSTGGLSRSPRSYAALGIDPAAEEIVGFVWVGHPARVPQVHRPPLGAVVRRLP